MLLFVYGTLLAGEPNHAQVAGARLVREAKTVAGLRVIASGSWRAHRPCIGHPT